MQATDGVLADPPPFVLQTALNDFSVSYEINAYVRSPVPLPRTYSALHANIQEAFNEAGVEIMSPDYFALRDGNQATTPRKHLPLDYVPPAFRVRHREERDVVDSEEITKKGGRAVAPTNVSKIAGSTPRALDPQLRQRLSGVLGFMQSRSAAPPAPRTRQFTRSRTATMWSRWTCLGREAERDRSCSVAMIAASSFQRKRTSSALTWGETCF